MITTLLQSKQELKKKQGGSRAVPTQHVQGALVVGDDDVGPLRLEMLPAADLESKAQQVLNVADQAADDPGGGMKERKRCASLAARPNPRPTNVLRTPCKNCFRSIHPADEVSRHSVNVFPAEGGASQHLHFGSE